MCITSHWDDITKIFARCQIASHFVSFGRRVSYWKHSTTERQTSFPSSKTVDFFLASENKNYPFFGLFLNIKKWWKWNCTDKLRPNAMDTNSSLSQTGQVPTQLTARKLNSRISYKIMPGFYYNKNVIYCAGEEQFYRHYNKTKKSHTYICRVDGCKCRIYIQNAQCFVANDLSHNHEKKTGMYYNLCALNEIKRILHSVDNKLLPKQVYDDVIQR